MNILIVNWSWYPTGGDWTYILSLIRFYESNGHNTLHFSMHNELNVSSPYSEYFVSKLDYKELNKKKSFSNGIRAINKSLFSKEASVNIEKILNDYKIDLVHFNNIHHYIPAHALIPILKKKNIPIIWTLHDFVTLCPNSVFISNNQICENCKGGKFYNCFLQKCKKNSYGASFIAAMEGYINKIKNPYKDIEYFICPSKFMMDKFIEYGFAPRKLFQIYNLYDASLIRKVEIKKVSAPNKYILYIGNILRIKGIFTLINAVKGLDIELLLVGKGEDLNECLELKKNMHLENINFLGYQEKSEVYSYIKGSQFVIAPSECYENLPYSIMESMLLEKPVLGSNIGGIPELIINKLTGYLFEAGNEIDLREKIEMMMGLGSKKLSLLGKEAKAHILNLSNPSLYNAKMSELFTSLGLRI